MSGVDFLVRELSLIKTSYRALKCAPVVVCRVVGKMANDPGGGIPQTPIFNSNDISMQDANLLRFKNKKVEQALAQGKVAVTSLIPTLANSAKSNTEEEKSIGNVTPMDVSQDGPPEQPSSNNQVSGISTDLKSNSSIENDSSALLQSEQLTTSPLSSPSWHGVSLSHPEVGDLGTPPTDAPTDGKHRARLNANPTNGKQPTNKNKEFTTAQKVADSKVKPKPFKPSLGKNWANQEAWMQHYQSGVLSAKSMFESAALNDKTTDANNIYINIYMKDGMQLDREYAYTLEQLKHIPSEYLSAERTRAEAFLKFVEEKERAHSSAPPGSSILTVTPVEKTYTIFFTVEGNHHSDRTNAIINFTRSDVFLMGGGDARLSTKFHAFENKAYLKAPAVHVKSCFALSTNNVSVAQYIIGTINASVTNNFGTQKIRKLLESQPTGGRSHIMEVIVQLSKNSKELPMLNLGNICKSLAQKVGLTTGRLLSLNNPQKPGCYSANLIVGEETYETLSENKIEWSIMDKNPAGALFSDIYTITVTTRTMFEEQYTKKPGPPPKTHAGSSDTSSEEEVRSSSDKELTKNQKKRLRQKRAKERYEKERTSEQSQPSAANLNNGLLFKPTKSGPLRPRPTTGKFVYLGRESSEDVTQSIGTASEWSGMSMEVVSNDYNDNASLKRPRTPDKDVVTDTGYVKRVTMRDRRHPQNSFAALYVDVADSSVTSNVEGIVEEPSSSNEMEMDGDDPDPGDSGGANNQGAGVEEWSSEATSGNTSNSTTPTPSRS